MKPKPTKTKTVQMPAVELRAAVAPSSVDAEARTIDATFYSGAEVVRTPLFDDPFLLSFDMSPKAVRLGRLNAGAAVVDSHRAQESIRTVLGVTGNARIEGGEGKATLRFSKRADVDEVWQDVQDGILSNLSMGVGIFALKELGTDDATGMQRLQATDWEPREISLVAVGADPGAQFTLAEEGEGAPCTITFRAEAAADAQLKENTMKKITVRLLSDSDDGKKGECVEILESAFDEELHSLELEPKAPAPKAPASRQDADGMAREIDEKLAADKAYAANIKRIASHYGCDDLWAQKQINLGVSTDDAIASATTERSKQSPAGPNSIGFGEDFDAVDSKLGRMGEALAARATHQEPTDAAKSYYGMSFTDLAVECLSLRGRGRGLNAKTDSSRIMSSELALHTTSDFPLLLANVMNKMLLPEYAQAEPTYRRIASEKQFNDFRPHQFLRSGDFPSLLKVNEHGEFKYGTMGENGEPVTAATYGRIVGLSRQTLINDDLSAFSDLATKAARRLADFENALFFSTCLTAGSGLGPDLSDSVAVYDAAHGNVTGSGALSNTLLGSALALMMAQTSIDGLKLNVEPSIILTSPTSVVLARTLLANITPSQASEVNPFAGQMTAIGDANLTGTRFYVLADPSILANYVYGYIGGQGPRTEVRSGFEVDGVEFKLALDFGVGAIDYRAGVTGAGA